MSLVAVLPVIKIARQRITVEHGCQIVGSEFALLDRNVSNAENIDFECSLCLEIPFTHSVSSEQV